MGRIILLAAALLTACTARPGAGYAQRGKIAPDWVEKTSTGQTVSMQSLRGKPVYLNFFATWCPPCNEEAPWINALQKQYAARGLQVLGVDELESAKKAEGFRKKFHLAYPALVDTGTLQSQYRINGLPVHVFIARDGTILRIVEGEMSRSAIASAVSNLVSGK